MEEDELTRDKRAARQVLRRVRAEPVCALADLDRGVRGTLYVGISAAPGLAVACAARKARADLALAVRREARAIFGVRAVLVLAPASAARPSRRAVAPARTKMPAEPVVGQADAALSRLQLAWALMRARQVGRQTRVLVCTQSMRFS
jgi:hypothetical protein